MFNFLYFNLCLLLLISLPCVYCLTEHQQEESASISFTSPTIRHSLYTWVRSLPSLLFGRLNSPSSPSLSLGVRCFNPLTSMAFTGLTQCVSLVLGSPVLDSAPDANSPGQSKEEGSPPLVCCQCSSQSSPGAAGLLSHNCFLTVSLASTRMCLLSAKLLSS